jgi:ketosteroid isomerase-like protein
MYAKTAREVDEIFVRAMNSGDIETIMSLYGPDTVFVQEPGKPLLSGEEILRDRLMGFLALSPQLSVEMKQFVETDDIAFFSVRWTLKGTDPGSEQPVTMTGIDGNVVRRQPDGKWRTLIDNPFHEQYLRA